MVHSAIRIGIDGSFEMVTESDGSFFDGWL